VNIKKMTSIVIIGIIALITIYDVYAWNVGGTEGTISWKIFEWSHEYPAFTFLMGFVMGHLFWQMKGLKRLNKE